MPILGHPAAERESKTERSQLPSSIWPHIKGPQRGRHRGPPRSRRRGGRINSRESAERAGTRRGLSRQKADD
jgi:hypothetical protein